MSGILPKTIRVLAWLILMAILACLPGLLKAQGTATMNPVFPARGASATISYNATGGPLAGASPVVIRIGYNGFQSTTESVMTGTAPNWSHTFTVPQSATSIDIVFVNQGGTIFDSNGGFGVDWQFLVAETLATPLGTTRVSPGQGGGYLFRVWAPNVTTASVVADFNGWAVDRDLMRKDAPSGTWTTHVPGAATGAEYKYLLNNSVYKKDPRARRVVNSSGNSIVTDPASFNWAGDVAVNIAGFRDLVIYEMHIGSWDTNGGPAPAEFQDAINSGRLDFLADLGVNAIQLMPVFEFPGDVSGGYNLSDPFAIESAYGGPDGLKAFVRASHQRGMAVLMDIVHNHYGPFDLDLYDFEGGGGPGIYFYTTPALLAETPFGPRPNYSQLQVRAYIRDNIDMLIDEYRLDGLRWDFTKAIRGTVDGGFNVIAPINEGISLLREINGMLDDDPQFISIAEDLAGESLITEPVSNPNGLGFDAQWNGFFHAVMVDELVKSSDSSRDMDRIALAIQGDFRRVHYLESHDEVWELNGKDRVPTRIDDANPQSYRARKLTGLGLGTLLTSPGIPMLFQGQEILDIGGPDGNDSWDEDEGTDWSRLSNPNILGFRDMVGDLVRLRRNTDGVSAGLTGENTNVFFVGDSVTPVVVYTRSTGGSNPGDTIVVLANFSANNYTSFDIGFPRAGRWHELFNSDNAAYGTDFTNRGVGQVVNTVGNPLHGFGQRGTVALGPYSMLVFSEAEPAVQSDVWIVR